MKEFYTYLWKERRIFLIILPLAYLIAGFYFRNLLGLLSLRSCDPEYIYFMSGLTLSDGTLKPGHFDNPGTPLQLFIALSFKLIYLFRATATPYLEDVFSHPDLYLSVVNLMITSLTAMLLFVSGKMVFRLTGSILMALLIQTIPFLPVIWYDLIGRITPELIFTFPATLLSVMVIWVMEKEAPVSRSQLLVFAVLSAFGLSIKLNFLPLWLIPFMLIGGWKRKLIFSGLSLLLFLIFAFPATLQIDFFWSWIKNLFLHSGQYGGGETDIINFTSLKSNLSELFNYERSFFYVLFGLMTVFAAYTILKGKKAEKMSVTVSAALILTIAVQLLMVGKHYAHRYFIPVLMLSPLLLYLIIKLLRQLIPARIGGWMAGILILVYLGWSIRVHAIWLPLKNEAMGADMENRLPTSHYAALLEKDSYRIITSQNYGCPLIEYTLMYSMAWASNSKKAEYAPILGKLYPRSYIYSTWDNTLRGWGEKFNADHIRSTGEKVYLYLERNEEELFSKTKSKLT
ncbi:MAG TPA: hypothetical protein PLW67_13820, partial [Prolixibacteraceae bacterium]|nr:hypothetical protein [Prolixibacteraceae bacterium]